MTIRPDRSWFDFFTIVFAIGVLVVLAFSLPSKNAPPVSKGKVGGLAIAHCAG